MCANKDETITRDYAQFGSSLRIRVISLLFTGIRVPPVHDIYRTQNFMVGLVSVSIIFEKMRIYRIVFKLADLSPLVITTS